MTGGSSGSGGESSMKSTEQLNPMSLQWTSGPQLPESLYGHCVVSINDTTILIIGGGILAEGSDKTFFFHHDGKYTVRSSLGEERTGIFKSNRPIIANSMLRI